MRMRGSSLRRKSRRSAFVIRRLMTLRNIRSMGVSGTRRERGCWRVILSLLNCTLPYLRRNTKRDSPVRRPYDTVIDSVAFQRQTSEDGTGMNETNIAVDKLQRIQELWRELGRTKSDAARYETLLKKIRVLSDEYQELVDAARKPKGSNDSCV
jgi:hypothetical protein